MYVDSDTGTLNLLIRGGDRSEGERAAERLRRELRDHGELGRLEVDDADFSFRELRRWYEPLRDAVLPHADVVTTDIDERLNPTRSAGLSWSAG